MSTLEHRHDPESIRKRLEVNNRANYLRDFIYGSIDGIVTTFAVIAGVVGAGLSHKTIIILGFANIVADGFSMAASNYLGTKAETDEREKILLHEQIQVKQFPEGEREEIRQIFKGKGFEGEVLEQIVEVISKDEKEWLNIMLHEEYGIGSTTRDPFLSALATFGAFLVFGFLPLIPFIFHFESSFLYASIIAGLSFFVVGSLKSKWSLESFYSSGLKTFFIGLVASLLAYFSGTILEGMVN